MAPAYLTQRDHDLLTAVERTPITVHQLRALSVTFSAAFGSERRLQDRLMILTRAGLLRRFRYAATEGVGRYYYVLTAESYRFLHGSEAHLPSPGLFRDVGIARQHHTRCLADFVVRTLVACHQASVLVGGFARENSLKLTVGEESLYPDCAFTCCLPDREFLYYIELDNSTEPLTSPRERDSWQRKLAFYEHLQDLSSTRFRVLGLITRSSARLRNIVALAGATAKNPNRSLFYGAVLADFVRCESPLFTPLFTDHRGLHVSLLPQPQSVISPPVQAAELAPATSV